MTDNFSLNYKIANSGCQNEIQDDFWEIVEKNPAEFIIEDKVDESKLKETYKRSARNHGVKIW